MFSQLQTMKLNKKGFTLIELIVVIAIIGILAAILIPRFSGFTDKAKATQAVVDAKQIATAIDSMIAEGAIAADFTVTNINKIANVTSGGTWTLDDAVRTNGYFTYAVNGFTAGRSAATAGAVKLITP